MEEKRTYYERILPPLSDRSARLEALKRRRDELVSRAVNRQEIDGLMDEIRWLNREIEALARR
jgi:hypothetical protein